MNFGSLTPNEEKILRFIERTGRSRNGLLPSMSEVMRVFGYKSPNSTQRYFKSLEEKGYIESLGRGKYRLLTQPQTGLRTIPMSGTVAAGLLTEAIEEIDSIELPLAMFDPNREYFGLKVVGDSMIEEHIVEGDTVILERTSSFHNGDIVAAMSDGLATLKRIFKDKDGIRLVAANPSYAPIIVKNDPSFRVLGKLKSVLRFN